VRYLIYTETFPEQHPNSPRQTGIGRYCADIALGLGELGHEVTVLTNAQSGPVGSNASGAVRVEVLGPPIRTGVGLWHRRSQVTGRVNVLRPDYVLVGDPGAHYVMAAWPFRQPGSLCPVFHGTELAEWGRVRRSSTSSPRAALRFWALRPYLASARALICNSRFTARLLREVHPDPARECVAYPCVRDLLLTAPVDPVFRAEVRRRVSRDGACPLILLTVGRISERKNQLRVIEALHHLDRQGQVEFHYIVVGNVDSEAHQAYFDRLRNYVKATGLEDRVTIVGHTTDEEKIGYIDACHLFVMLSQAVGDSVEGFGISVIEAACRGKPVLVSNQGGMPETVVSGQTGVVVAADDVPAIAGTLASLARDPASLEEMGAAGRRFVAGNFTPAVVAARLHEQLLTKRR
jgi:glycosyltransferase involved in cell wall biosynthesis